MEKSVPRKLLGPRPQDYILGAVLIAASVVWLVVPSAAGRGPLRARLVHDGRVVAELPLDKPAKRSFDFEAGEIAVEVTPGRGIHISETHCPNKICMHEGWIDRPGETIACLPNRFLVEIEGGEPEYDAVVD